MLTRLTFAACLALLLNACSDGGSSSNSPPPMMDPPPANTTDISVDLSSDQVAVASSLDVSASAGADLTLNNDDNTLSGTVTVSGLTANSVTLRSGFAGDTGAALVMLNDDGGGQWSVPPNTVLTDADLEALENGGLYVHVTTADMPDGALRGQILMGGIDVLRVELNSVQSVPRVTSDAGGVAFVTFNSDEGTLVAHVNTVGVDDAFAAHIHQAFAGATGDIVVDLVQDPEDPGHWLTEGDEQSNEIVALEEGGVAALNDAELYFNVHTPANMPGEIRGQIVPDDIDLIQVNLTSLQSVPLVTSDADGVAFLTYDGSDGSIIAHVNNTGVDDAFAGHIHQGLAGQTGAILIDLVQDPESPGHWFSEDATLDESGMTALNAAELYFNIHTPANMPGEIRGQIVPDAIGVIFTELTGDEAGATTTARAVAALTVNVDSGAADAFVNTSELDDAMGVSLNQAPAGETGPSIVDFVLEDAMNPTRWAARDITFSEDELGVLGDDGLYYLVTTPAFPDGEMRGQLIAPDSLTLPDAPDGGGSNATFTFIQNEVFSPICAECHAGANPNAGLDLSDGQAYGNIVEVPSNQVPELFRIDPGNPDDSYLVRKIEGTGMFGRMPLNRPPLDQETIDTIRQWVSEGAQNN